MKLIKQIAEKEFVAIFLKHEIDSPRFGESIKDRIKKDGEELDVILSPDLANEKENQYRKEFLGKFRGYKRNCLLFDHFPHDIEWYRALLNKEELKTIKYINYDYWIELSGGSRLPSDALDKITKGTVVMGEKINHLFIAAANKVKEGYTLPPMILVGKDKNSDLVVLEGHLRLTAYMLEPDYIPEKLDVIIGFSSNIIEWKLF